MNTVQTLQQANSTILDLGPQRLRLDGSLQTSVVVLAGTSSVDARTAAVQWVEYLADRDPALARFAGASISVRQAATRRGRTFWVITATPAA